MRHGRFTAYAYIPSLDREKIDEKGEKYLFIGYNGNQKYTDYLIKKQINW